MLIFWPFVRGAPCAVHEQTIAPPFANDNKKNTRSDDFCRAPVSRAGLATGDADVATCYGLHMSCPIAIATSLPASARSALRRLVGAGDPLGVAMSERLERAGCVEANGARWAPTRLGVEVAGVIAAGGR